MKHAVADKLITSLCFVSANDNAPVGQVNAGAPETVTYLHTDHLGTPRAGSNAAGAVVWAWANDAFGVSAPTGSVPVNLRMAGQYADSESGLFYNWNRYYKPSIGRYISSDPIGLEGGLNTFGYVGQNPVNNVDPSGLRCVYSQSTGNLHCTNDTSGQEYLSCSGYAGNGEGLNNPDAQDQENVGPIPRGDYTVGDPTRRRGPITRPLTPSPDNNMHGRGGFLIHGDNARGNNSASQGCIIVNRACRSQIPSGETVTVTE